MDVLVESAGHPPDACNRSARDVASLPLVFGGVGLRDVAGLRNHNLMGQPLLWLVTSSSTIATLRDVEVARPNPQVAFCPIFVHPEPHVQKWVIFVRRRPCVCDTFSFDPSPSAEKRSNLAPTPSSSPR